MNINEANYEAFFLDYYEGNLQPAQVRELMLFLNLHPALKEQFNEFENIVLPGITIPFDNKAQLKKQLLLTPENCSDFFVRYVEDTLNEEEQKQLQLFLTAHPSYDTEFSLYKKTKLQADLAIVFEHKSELKKSAKRKKTMLYYWSVAASLAIFISCYFIFNQLTNINTTPEAMVNASVKERAVLPATGNSSVPTALAKLPTKVITSNSSAASDKADISPKNNAKLPKSNAAAVSKEQQTLIPNKLQLVVNEKLNTSLKPIAGLNATSPPSILLAASTPVAPAPEYVSLAEFAAKKISEKYATPPTTEDDAEDDNYAAENRKQNGWDMIFSKILNSVTGKGRVFTTRRNDEGQITAYQFSAGNIEFSRSVGK